MLNEHYHHHYYHYYYHYFFKVNSAPNVELKLTTPTKIKSHRLHQLIQLEIPIIIFFNVRFLA